MPRLLALIVCLGGLVGASASDPPVARAHPLSTTAVLLDIEADHATARIQMPIDRLAIALNRPLTAPVVAMPGVSDQLRRYVAAHVSVADAGTGAEWAATVTGGSVETIDGVDHVVYLVELVPPDGRMRDFTLHYDGIVHRLSSHRVFVSARPEGSDSYTTIGVIGWESDSITVPVQGAPSARGFWAAVRLGVAHISTGADHLLFLLTLLLPAPLLASSGRWVRQNDLRRNGLRVLHIVTAFAVGHSMTLALVTIGVVSVPVRIVESLIALSILVSAVHALRPLARGGEVWIATGFGLMHGVAFAGVLRELDLGWTSLVTALLGFNVGIELTQLVVVVLVMPSLMLLSRTRAYGFLRICLAAVAILLAGSWFAERTTLVAANPLEGVSAALVDHPFVLAASLAVVSLLAWSVRPLRIFEENRQPPGPH